MSFDPFKQADGFAAAAALIVESAEIAKQIDQQKVHTEIWFTGRVKWYDRVRRWGFVVPDDGGPDVFLPWTPIQDCGIKENKVITNARVRYQWEPPEREGRKRKVTKIQLIVR